MDIPELGDAPWENNNVIQNVMPDTLDHFMIQNIDFENAPYCVWKYIDHLEKVEHVCVVIPVMSGSRDVSFSLSEDGLKLEVNYLWPKAIYDPKLLFENAVINGKKIPMDHPKIHAFTSHLLELGITEKSNPKGKIIIDLPTQVQREVGTWSKSGLTINETKIVVLEFKAFTKTRIIDDADTTIRFE